MRSPRGALLVAALAALSSDLKCGAQAHYIWLTGETLEAEQPERTAGTLARDRWQAHIFRFRKSGLLVGAFPTHERSAPVRMLWRHRHQLT